MFYILWNNFDKVVKCLYRIDDHLGWHFYKLRSLCPLDYVFVINGGFIKTLKDNWHYYCEYLCVRTEMGMGEGGLRSSFCSNCVLIRARISSIAAQWKLIIGWHFERIAPMGPCWRVESSLLNSVKIRKSLTIKTQIAAYSNSFLLFF